MAGGTEARTHRVLKVIFYPEEHSTTRVAGGRRRRIPPPHAPDMNPPTFRFPPFNGGEAGQMRRRRSAMVVK